MKKRNQIIAAFLAATMIITPATSIFAKAAKDGSSSAESSYGESFTSWRTNEWENKLSKDWTTVSMTPGVNESTMNFAWYSKTTDTVSLTYGLKADLSDGKTVQITTKGTEQKDKDGNEFEIHAENTIWASGGIGGRYKHSTNFPHLTGDALTISEKHGIRLEHLDYVQIHPTTLYSKKPGRRFLISESVRGERAVLLNSKKERFVNELLPRDVVTKAIREEMEKEGTDHVWLSMEKLGKETIMGHFPNIYQHCLEEGYDVTKECIPVVPAQHYFMGGVWVDSDSKTSMEHLYAVGETSCNGVHGANRLASNSLLESLVFAKRAAHKISGVKNAVNPVLFCKEAI